MTIIRGVHALARTSGPYAHASMDDPLRERAAVVFAAELAADRVPSVRAIRAALRVGQPRARRLRDYLAAAAETHGENLAA
jgi:Cdc6-like AAA superfamily ATPase